MKKIAGITLILSCLWQSLAAQTHPDSIKVVKKELATGISLIRMAGCNMILSCGDDGALIIDGGYTELAAKLLSEIHNTCNKPLKYIVNTHWHFDHVGLNLKRPEETSVIAHSAVKELLSRNQFLLGDTIPAHPAHLLPDISFSSFLELVFNGDTVKLYETRTAGHSNGDILVYFPKTKILHIGDLVFADMFPFCDTEHGGNVKQMSQNIKDIINKFPAGIRIIPGHGRELSMQDIKVYSQMIDSTYAIVSRCYLNGMTIDQMKKDNVLAAYKDWAVAFSCYDWIDMIGKSLRGDISNSPK